MRARVYVLLSMLFCVCVFLIAYKQVYRFNIIPGNLRGRKILDVGTGPVVFPIITASKWFDEVYLSDISKPCLELLEKWERGDSDHMRPLMESFVAKDGEG